MGHRFRKSYSRHVANAFGRYYVRNVANKPATEAEDKLAKICAIIVALIILIGGSFMK